MKTLYQIIIATFLLNTLPICAQVTVSIYYHDNRDIETNFYGFHMSNFFEQCICYDPDSPGPSDEDIDQCMSFAASLKPKVVRFPAGGDHKFMHLLDDDGYGYREVDIDEFVNQDWLTTSAAADLYSYIDMKQEVDFNDIRFIDRFIDFLEFCETENGYKPQVIFVANILLTKLDELYTENSIFREIEHENMEVMRYLMDHDVEIVGIEMGNEHYDDKDLNGDAIFNNGGVAPSFNNYFQTCRPMLDSLDSDPDFNSIPVALLAAPEPLHGAATGIGSTKVGYYEDWNTKLKTKATSPSTSGLFDAYTVHIYNRPDDLPECYRLYYDDYVKTNPNNPINLIDNLIIPAWECAQDSFRNYTTKTLQTILNNYAGTCTTCLGNDKPYWISEWGLFGVDNNSPEVNYGYSTLLNDTVAGNFGDTFIDAAYAFQYLLEMMDYDAGLDGIHSADIDFMIKHNFVSKSVGGAINYRSGTDPQGEDDPVYIRRANYWPFYLMSDIFKKNYERINSSVELIGSETRTPFIKCFYYDNPATQVLPFNFCGSGGQGTGSTSNPVFYMYYYNPYPDDITFKHEEMIGWYDDPNHTFTPTSNQAAFKKYFEVDNLYEHGGINQYMKDNSFYNSLTNVSPDIDEISSQVIHLCEDDSIVLNAYSIGYVYWEITPEPYRVGNFTEDTYHKLWPVPAEKTAYIQLTLPNEEDFYTLNLFSITGELVQQKDFSASGYDIIEREDLSAGMYFYSIINQAGLEVVKGKMIWE